VPPSKQLRKTGHLMPTDWRWWIVIGVGLLIFFALGVAFEREMWVRRRPRGRNDKAVELALWRLEEARLALKVGNSQEAANSIMDVMDQLTGYCSPHARLTQEDGAA